MNNLIVTIIGIALVAIAAVTGIFYGGTAYQNAQINAIANSIMNEAQQILYAERLWSSNNGQPDISGMGTAATAGTGISALVNNKELAEWPSFGGNMGVSMSLTNPGPQPTLNSSSYTTQNIGSFDYGCFSVSGYYGKFYRILFSYNNGNYVLYGFQMNTPYTAPCTTQSGLYASSATDVSKINHPIVKIAKAINNSLNQIPANANMTAMAYSGIPLVPAGSTLSTETQVYDTSNIFAQYSIYFNTNGAVQSNYCYFRTSSFPADGIICVFGPS